MTPPLCHLAGWIPPALCHRTLRGPPYLYYPESPKPPHFCYPSGTVGSVRDDEIRRVLTEANPWWRAAAAGQDPVEAVRSHRLIRDRARHDLGYRPSVLKDLATGPVGDSLVVLTGPRRVGKSVALLDLAAELCGRKDIQPFQVIHVPCDGMAARDLRRAFTLGRELTRPADLDAPRARIWLLDEVSAIAGWTTIVKAARDGTAVGDDTVVVTGSRWQADEDVAGNLLAGRAGSAGLRRVRHLLPMTFRDFATATRPALLLPEAVHPADLQSPDVAATLDGLRFEVDSYDLAWQDYLSCGGFPRAVAEHSRNGAVSIDYIHDLAAWLRGDVNLEGPPESLPLFLEQLAGRATSPLNVAHTAEALGWTRAVTAARLNRLVSGFGALWCRHHDDSGRPVAGSQPKLYLVDPVLGWMPSRLRAGLRPPQMTALTEQALGVALARRIDHLDEGRWVAGDTIGYTRTGSGNEIDLVPVAVPSGGTTLESVPIEGKWVDDGWRSEAKVIENKFRRGILATKSLLDLDHPSWAIPAPLVALMLE